MIKKEIVFTIFLFAFFRLDLLAQTQPEPILTPLPPPLPPPIEWAQDEDDPQHFTGIVGNTVSDISILVSKNAKEAARTSLDTEEQKILDQLIQETIGSTAIPSLIPKYNPNVFGNLVDTEAINANFDLLENRLDIITASLLDAGTSFAASTLTANSFPSHPRFSKKILSAFFVHYLAKIVSHDVFGKAQDMNRLIRNLGVRVLTPPEYFSGTLDPWYWHATEEFFMLDSWMQSLVSGIPIGMVLWTGDGLSTLSEDNDMQKSAAGVVVPSRVTKVLDKIKTANGHLQGLYDILTALEIDKQALPQEISDRLAGWKTSISQISLPPRPILVAATRGGSDVDVNNISLQSTKLKERLSLDADDNYVAMSHRYTNVFVVDASDSTRPMGVEYETEVPVTIDYDNGIDAHSIEAKLSVKSINHQKRTITQYPTYGSCAVGHRIKVNPKKTYLTTKTGTEEVTDAYLLLPKSLGGGQFPYIYLMAEGDYQDSNRSDSLDNVRNMVGVFENFGKFLTPQYIYERGATNFFYDEYEEKRVRTVPIWRWILIYVLVPGAWCMHRLTNRNSI